MRMGALSRKGGSLKGLMASGFGYLVVGKTEMSFSSLVHLEHHSCNARKARLLETITRHRNAIIRLGIPIIIVIKTLEM